MMGDSFTAASIFKNQIAFFAVDLAYIRARLPEQVRIEVLSANHGLCMVCNTAPATEVDHIADGSNDRSNLQGLCHECHFLKPATPIPADLTRAGDGVVDESADYTPLLEAWRTALWSPSPYRSDEPAEEWKELSTVATQMSETRFGHLTLGILDDQVLTPAHHEEWAQHRGVFQRATRAWAARKAPR